MQLIYLCVLKNSVRMLFDQSERGYSVRNAKLVGALFPTNHVKPQEHIKDRAGDTFKTYSDGPKTPEAERSEQATLGATQG